MPGECDKGISNSESKTVVRLPKGNISMFRMADEAYATKNAIDELKEIATGIIESNNMDGVARWLEEHTRDCHRLHME